MNLRHGEDGLTDHLSGLQGPVRVGGPLERERRADLNAQIARVEVHRGLLEDGPLPLSLLRPAEYLRGRHPGKGDRYELKSLLDKLEALDREK